MQIVVADKKRYYIGAGGKLLKEVPAKVLREKVVITKDMVDRANEATSKNGVFYEIDKAATKEYNAKSKKHNEEIAKKEQVKKAMAAATLKMPPIQV